MSTMAKYNILDDVFNNGTKSYHFEVTDNGVKWGLRLVYTRTNETVDYRNLEDSLVRPSGIDPVWYNHTVKVNQFCESHFSDPDHPLVREMREKADKDNSITLIDFLNQHNAEVEEHRRLYNEWIEKKLEESNGEPVYIP